MHNFLAFRRFTTAVLLVLISTITAFSQHSAYYLFRENGKKVKYEKMVEEAARADVILFGELHNNPISHWLQIELTGDLYAVRGSDLMLGAEMFEADNQLILDEYLAGLITQQKFEDEARLWQNYKTDYKPLLEFANNHHLSFIATNVPRRYANSVFKKGLTVLDSISEEARRYMAPLPLEYDTSLNCYNQLIHGSGMQGHGSINLADAQAIKDATMAHFIMENRKPGSLMIHFNGAYHSDEFESIHWWLKQASPDLRILTISTLSSDTPETLSEEDEGKADFIISIPSNMTTTY